jgi:hypothetical protein
MLAQEILTLPQGLLPHPAAASLAAQTHAKSSVLAPLLSVASAVDAMTVLRAGSGFFESLSAAAGGGYAPSGAVKVRAKGVAIVTSTHSCMHMVMLMPAF